ncbi:hypothetical protein NQ315_008666 [Exocentrus adspersus]|uniref:Uncharacterized protein n=1 Tax=Exocentrus adspersus TaxID=1586481 RepID=A0AAV8W7B6_9CUCU|nr:hypothetical protein NQ315_008666 [Exocentrus adspersus]
MFTFASVFVALVVVVSAEPPVRENSRFTKQAPGAFQPILLRPLAGQFVVLEQLQSATPEVPQVDPLGEARNATEAGSSRNSTEEVETSTPGARRSEKLTQGNNEGIYYIYHPNGLLQRVTYATKDDVERMAFSARLRYENVEPIREPIYTYDPETYVFKRV